MPTTHDQRWPRAISTALEKVVDGSGLDLAFGARVAADGRHLTIDQFRGTRTGALQGLVVHSGTGLGGKALMRRRPATVADYVHAMTISHEYDLPVSQEGMHSVLAVPVLVSGRVAGVIYAALRQRLPIGDRTQQAVMAIAREAELALTEVSPPAPSALGGTTLSDVAAELGSILARTRDPVTRSELTALRARLSQQPQANDDERALSEREREALGHVARGLSNAQIAERMGLTVGTVKAYLRSVMRKLDSANRVAAVNAARERGYPF